MSFKYISKFLIILQSIFLISCQDILQSNKITNDNKFVVILICKFNPTVANRTKTAFSGRPSPGGGAEDDRHGQRRRNAQRGCRVVARRECKCTLRRAEQVVVINN